MENITNYLNHLFHFVGFLVFFVAAIVAMVYACSKFYMWSMNKLGKIFKHLWILVEYAYYRKDFKEFMKDKNRIKSPEDLMERFNKD